MHRRLSRDCDLAVCWWAEKQVCTLEMTGSARFFTLWQVCNQPLVTPLKIRQLDKHALTGQIFWMVCRLTLKEQDGNNIIAAHNDLTRKFAWILNYSHLPFIFGIAISRDYLRILTLSPTGHRTVFSANLLDEGRKWSCVIAAVNIARSLLCFQQNDLYIPAELQCSTFGTTAAKTGRKFTSPIALCPSSIF
jgi:hypothetical protein